MYALVIIYIFVQRLNYWRRSLVTVAVMWFSLKSFGPNASCKFDLSFDRMCTFPTLDREPMIEMKFFAIFSDFLSTNKKRSNFITFGAGSEFRLLKHTPSSSSFK